jgi:hypothetical protein
MSAGRDEVPCGVAWQLFVGCRCMACARSDCTATNNECCKKLNPTNRQRGFQATCLCRLASDGESHAMTVFWGDYALPQVLRPITRYHISDPELPRYLQKP